MNRELLKYAAIGLGLLIVLTAGVLFWNRGAHVVLEGDVQKVRLQAMDERSTVVVIDFRFVNPSDYPFIVREAKVFLDDADGNRHEGMGIGEVDSQRLFQYYPLLGQKFNRSLIFRDRIASKESMDRMICARFELPEPSVQARKGLVIRVEDVDGVVSEIVEDRKSEQR